MSKKIRLLFTLFITFSVSGTTQTTSDSLKVSDGPYIFIKDTILANKTIVNGEVKTSQIPINSLKISFENEKSVFKNVKKIAALSDIHGQYDVAIEILKNNKIINKNLDWSFGKGHLVIVGDIFDRGDKVTETLWFIYNLERQAKKSGGKVHYLLGNHEYMVLHNDVRYLDSKYIYTSQLLELSFSEMFGKQTVLGRWLRSKNTILKINDKLFVHGGISEEFIQDGLNLEETNNLMRVSIDREKEEMKTVPFYNKYYGTNGPIWYRGYFKDEFTEIELDRILRKLNVNQIIVGHTSQKEVMQLYNNKVFVVDSSIKNGEYGEILIIKNQKFKRKTMQGCKVSFQ